VLKLLLAKGINPDKRHVTKRLFSDFEKRKEIV